MSVPSHVAVIMDGNGRWAGQRGLPRLKGHKAGVQAAEEIIEAASDAGVKHLTLYAFSTENWRRPALEVAALMAIFRVYLRIFTSKLIRHRVRFHHLGTREGLPAGILKDIDALEAATAHLDGMVFHLAVNYGSRLEMVEAARACVRDGLSPEAITEEAINARLWTAGVPDVDLLIRTSGEFRISNFLLWQCAYAEFYLTETHWPDFRTPQFLEAIGSYGTRERRFGAL